jgi:pyridoxine 4-dehydrogenase
MNPRRLILGCSRTPPTADLLAGARDLGVTEIDTAFSYNHFGSLDQLRKLDATRHFQITSKVGLLPTPGRSVRYSLEPRDLQRAMEDTCRRLGAPVQVMLLHNPETALAETDRDPLELFDGACAAMTRAVEQGWAARWGISTWEPASLLPFMRLLSQPPDVLMMRSGLSVSPHDMCLIHALRTPFEGTATELRGMAPFGGSRSIQVLASADVLKSCCPGGTSTAQVALRLAFELPPVEALCLSTSRLDHLAESVAACQLAVDTGHISDALGGRLAQFDKA